jgi:hypothetical protein
MTELNMTMRYLLLLLLIPSVSFAQEPVDTMKAKELQEVIIRSWMRRDISRLSDVQENIIIATGFFGYLLAFLALVLTCFPLY